MHITAAGLSVSGTSLGTYAPNPSGSRGSLPPGCDGWLLLSVERLLVQCAVADPSLKWPSTWVFKISLALFYKSVFWGNSVFPAFRAVAKRNIPVRGCLGVEANSCLQSATSITQALISSATLGGFFSYVGLLKETEEVLISVQNFLPLSWAPVAEEDVFTDEICRWGQYLVPESCWQKWSRKCWIALAITGSESAKKWELTPSIFQKIPRDL